MRRQSVSESKQSIDLASRGKPGLAGDKPEIFLVQPYLQLGSEYRVAPSAMLEIVWHSSGTNGVWSVQSRSGTAKRWKGADALIQSPQKLIEVPVHLQYRARVSGMKPGEKFDYRVLLDGKEVFRSSATAPKAKGQATRFAVLGDLTDGSISSKRVTNSLAHEGLDLMVLAGDLVYDLGRVSEYLSHFFPVYNADHAHFWQGAPLLRSVISAAAAGNHDMGTPRPEDKADPDKYPDALGYFRFWHQPNNGPKEPASCMEKLAGSRKKREKLCELLGHEFLRHSNFSFDHSDAHWLVLDGNKHMDWTSESLKKWVDDDLSQSKALWKFVVVHQAPFNTDKKYAKEQRLRLLAEIFERNGVDVVFSGHCHVYQRTKPIRYELKDGGSIKDDGTVPGKIKIDTKFDGVRNTTPDGIVYMITGTGGKLVDADHKTETADWTEKLVQDRNSYTIGELDGEKLILKQIDLQGNEIDRMTIVKRGAARRKPAA